MRHKHRKHFSITLLLSLVVHLFILTVLFTIPDNDEQEGYKKVTVKLGIKGKPGGGAIQKYAASSPEMLAAGQIGNGTRNLPEVQGREPALNKNIENKNANKDIEKSGKNITSLESPKDENKTAPLKEKQEFERVLEQASKNINLPQPAITDYVPAAGKPTENTHEEEGTVIGNSVEKDADKLTSYEQLLPLWLYKFKKYPDEAKANHVAGVGEIFIKIDRKGRILLSKIIKSTGSPVLDNALIQMIADADPVIPVPNDYHSDKKTFSYKIAFAFEDNK